MCARPRSGAIFGHIHACDIMCSRSAVLQPPGRTPAMVARGTQAFCLVRAMPFAPWFDLRVVRSHLSAWIRAPPTISEATASRMHLVEPGEKNVRVSRSSCVEWSDARESVFMVCGRRPRRVLKLRSRKTDAVIKLSIHQSPLLFTSQTHVCSDTGATHDQRRHTLAISSCQWLFFQRTRRRQKPD